MTQAPAQTLYEGGNWIIFQALTPVCTADRFSHLAKEMIDFAHGKSILEIILECMNGTMLQSPQEFMLGKDHV